MTISLHLPARGHCHSKDGGIGMGVKSFCLSHCDYCLSQRIHTFHGNLLIGYLPYKTVKVDSAHRTGPTGSRKGMIRT